MMKCRQRKKDGFVSSIITSTIMTRVKNFLKESVIGRIYGVIEKFVYMLFNLLRVAGEYREIGKEHREFYGFDRVVGSSASRITQLLSAIKNALIKGKAAVSIVLLKQLKEAFSGISNVIEKGQNINQKTAEKFAGQKPYNLLKKAAEIIVFTQRKIEQAIELIKVRAVTKMENKNYVDTPITIDRKPRRLRAKRDSLFSEAVNFAKNVKLMALKMREGYVSDGLIGIGSFIVMAWSNLKGFVSDILSRIITGITYWQESRNLTGSAKSGANATIKNHFKQIGKELANSIFEIEKAKALLSRLYQSAKNVKVKEAIRKLLEKLLNKLSNLKGVSKAVDNVAQSKTTSDLFTSLAIVKSLAA